MALFQLDQVFSYQDANDIKRLWAHASAPANPGDGEVWLDLSTTPIKLKRYKSSVGTWETIAGTTNAELLAALKNVDGTGSGLDADLLDGQEGTFYRNAGNLNAGTVPLACIPTTLTGKDADKLDGQEGSFYLNATNLNAGSVARTQLPAEIAYSDTDKTVNANYKWADDKQIRTGTDNDLRLFHSSAYDNSYIDNYYGDLYIRQLSHGEKIYLQAEDASGNMKTLATLDPTVPCAKFDGAVSIGEITDLVISNGAITVSKSYHAIDTEGGAASDELTTINGGQTGQLLILQAISVLRPVTVVENTGNLRLAGNFVLSKNNDKIMLIAMDKTSSGGILEWHEISRSNND